MKLKIQRELVVAERLGMTYYAYLNHHTMSECSLILGDGEEAEKRYIDGLKYYSSVGNLFYAAAIVFMLAMGLALQGRYAKSFRLCHAGLLKIKVIKIDILQVYFVKKLHERIMEPLITQLDKDKLDHYKIEGEQLSWNEVLEYAMDTHKD